MNTEINPSRTECKTIKLLFSCVKAKNYSNTSTRRPFTGELYNSKRVKIIMVLLQFKLELPSTNGMLTRVTRSSWIRKLLRETVSIYGASSHIFLPYNNSRETHFRDMSQ